MANQLFLETLEQTARPRDRVWIHDYHLMLLPASVTRALPRTCPSAPPHPFPPTRCSACCPPHGATELLEVPGADLAKP
ncbi:MAG: trehalose-6-phosphate synthase [Flavobacteriales bacterium]|nr:trehalose-6-phosphate synthase [Flavobacteriales bacterium]